MLLPEHTDSIAKLESRYGQHGDRKDPSRLGERTKMCVCVCLCLYFYVFVYVHNPRGEW